MRALFGAVSVISVLSAVAITVLLSISVWTPYVATVVVDFARVSGVTHNFLANCASSAFQLRWEVIVYAWLGAVWFVGMAIAIDHTRRSKESFEAYYDKYIWWLWLGLIVTTLPGSFIVASMSGVTTITVLLLVAFTGMLSFVLIGPVHAQLNENIGKDVHWIVFSVGALILVAYVILLLSYLIQAVAWGHSVPWQHWTILAGDLAIRIAIAISAGLTWVGVRPILIRPTFIKLVTSLALIHFLWVPWFFFARTVAFTP